MASTLLMLIVILLVSFALPSSNNAFPTYFANKAPLFLTVDSDQNVWVANSGAIPEGPNVDFYGATKLNQEGKILGTYTRLPNPTTIAADQRGFVYLLSRDSGDVAKLNATSFKMIWTKNLVAGGGNSHIDLDSKGNIWVSSYGRHEVSKASNDGEVLGTFRLTKGCCTKGLAVDSQDNIWVGSYPSYVGKLSSRGTEIGWYTVGFDPWNVAVDFQDNVWVPSAGSNSVAKLSNNGQLLKTIPTLPTPWGLDFDIQGNLWVSNNDYPCRGSTMQKFSSSGNLIQTYTVGLGALGLKIDNSGNVWVANCRNSSVTKIPSLPYPTVSPTPSPYFMRVRTKMTYLAAEAYCLRRFGTHLATINSATKQQLLKNSLRKKSALWIGLKFNPAQNKFEWVSGADTVFANWHPNKTTSDPTPAVTAQRQEATVSDGDRVIVIKSSSFCATLVCSWESYYMLEIESDNGGKRGRSEGVNVISKSQTPTRILGRQSRRLLRLLWNPFHGWIAPRQDQRLSGLPIVGASHPRHLAIVMATRFLIRSISEPYKRLVAFAVAVVGCQAIFPSESNTGGTTSAGTCI